MNAAESYKARLAEVRNSIRRLDGLLTIHERRAALRPNDWGYAGDLGHLAEKLAEHAMQISCQDRRCEWKHPRTCGAYATICTPDGRLLCGEHAIESDSDPRDCLDLVDGTPVDSD